MLKRLFGVPASNGQSSISAPTPSEPSGPTDVAKEWRRKLTAEGRNVDRQIRKIQREEAKVKQSAKQAAKVGDPQAVRILAREMIHSRKTVKRLGTAKTQMNSVAMQIQMQASQMKVVGTLAKSAEVMAGMNDLLKVPEITQVMQEMSREMTKAGLIEEMVGDTLDDTLDDGIEEEDLDEEVAKVVKEVMDSQLKGAKVGSHALPAAPAAEAVPEEGAGEEVEEDDDALMAKFAALKAAGATA